MKPPYMQVADLIRADITAGRYAPGDKLPSRQELAKTHNVAHMTIQNAIRVLREEGLITTRQGDGCYVSHKTLLRPRDYAAEIDYLTQRVQTLETQVRQLQAESQPRVKHQ